MLKTIATLANLIKHRTVHTNTSYCIVINNYFFTCSRHISATKYTTYVSKHLIQ